MSVSSTKVLKERFGLPRRLGWLGCCLTSGITALPVSNILATWLFCLGLRAKDLAEVSIYRLSTEGKRESYLCLTYTPRRTCSDFAWRQFARDLSLRPMTFPRVVWRFA